MTAYRRGYEAERRTRSLLYADGALLVVRSAGSKTPVDLTAFYPGCIKVVQVKRCKDGRNWYDKNCSRLAAFEFPANVLRSVYVWRRGAGTPEVHSI